MCAGVAGVALSAKKYNYLSELRSYEKRVEEGGREETAGGRWGGGRAEGG